MNLFYLDPVGITLLEESRRILSNQLTLLPRQEHFEESLEGKTFIGDLWINDLFALVRREGAIFPLDVRANPNGGKVLWDMSGFHIEVWKHSYTIELHQNNIQLLRVTGTGDCVWKDMEALVLSLNHQNDKVQATYRAWFALLTREVPHDNLMVLQQLIKQHTYDKAVRAS